jgi:hypothetical protein
VLNKQQSCGKLGNIALNSWEMCCCFTTNKASPLQEIRGNVATTLQQI